jgi:hypothetical protein
VVTTEIASTVTAAAEEIARRLRPHAMRKV